MLHQHQTNSERLDLIEIKRHALGPITSDTGVELTEAEFLLSEIAETKEKRRSLSIPLIGIGSMITAFSFASATPLSRLVAFLIGTLSISLGVYLIVKHTQQIKQLKRRLIQTQSTESSVKNG